MTRVRFRTCADIPVAGRSIAHSKCAAAMATPFDPYFVWLGIPPEEQPADFYRFFGLKQFEDNREVICHAVDRQMAHIYSFQNSQHDRDWERIVSELTKAAGCLLNPSRRAIYDQHLRSMQVANQYERAMTPPTAEELAIQNSRNRKSSQPPPRPRTQSHLVRSAIISLLISGAVMAILLLAGFLWFAQ
jgi:DNA primase